MGTWGFGTTENDTAADFLGDMEEQGTWEPFEEAAELLSGSLPDGEYIESLVGDVVLAAADLVAHQEGRLNSPWAREAEPGRYPQCPPEYRALLVQALPRVIDGPDSETRELWEDAGELEEWLKVCEPIRVALNA